MPVYTRPIARIIAPLALCLALGAVDAWAQDDPPAQDPGAVSDAPDAFALDVGAASPQLRSHLSDQLARVARKRLVVTEDPSGVDYRAMAEAIAGARSLVGPDAELLRLEIEARLAGVDEEGASRLSRELLRIDPRDQVAQLRVAIDAVRDKQTAIGRLEAYELFLGPRGNAFDPSIRSRLAVDAALIARERGSERQFIEYITLATTLDPSNKEAAALYASHFLALTDDPVERADLLTNIVLADPLDPEALQNLAIELVQHGAYAGAYDLLNHTFSVYALLRQAPPLRLRVELTLAEWNEKGTDHLLDYTQELEDTLQGRMDGERERAIANGLDPGPERDAILPLELEALRLAAGIVQRDDEVITRMLARCVQAGLDTNDALREAAPDEVAAQRSVDTMALTLLWCRLFAGRELDTAREQLAYFTDPDNPNALSELARQRFEGWLALHEGDADRARALIEPIAERDRHAKWVLGLIEEARGNQQRALFHFAGIAQRHPNTAIGTAAWFRTLELHGGDLTRSPVGDRLSREATQLVEWLEASFLDPKKYMAVDVRPVGNTLDPFDGAEVEIRVRNRTGWPLAIGANAPVPPQILLTPIITFGTGDLVEATVPETVSIPGRLRLGGNEEHTFRVRLARRVIGDVLEIATVQRSTVRWQATLGFAHDGRRAVAQPLSVSAQTPLIPIRRVSAAADAGTLLEAVDGAAGLPRAIAIRTAVLGSSPSVMQELGMDQNLFAQRRSVLLNGLASAYRSLDEAGRALTVLGVTSPIVRIQSDEFEALGDAMEGEPSAFVSACFACSGGIRERDHPLLGVLAGAPEAWARALARHLEDGFLIRDEIDRLQQGG